MAKELRVLSVGSIGKRQEISTFRKEVEGVGILPIKLLLHQCRRFTYLNSFRRRIHCSAQIGRLNPL